MSVSRIRHAQRKYSCVKAGFRWYMSSHKWEVLSDFVVSMTLALSGLYALTLGFNLSGGMAFAAAGLVSADFAKLVRYFAQYERPPPKYEDEWQEHEQERERRRESED